MKIEIGLALAALCFLSHPSHGAWAQENAPVRESIAPMQGAETDGVSRFEQDVARALEHFAAGHYAEALEMFDTAREESPEGADVATLAFNAAVCAYALGDYEEAQQRFEGVMMKSPKLAKLSELHAGMAALRAEDLQSARRHALVSVGEDAELLRLKTQLTTDIRSQERRARQEQLHRLIDEGFAQLNRGQLRVARMRLTQAWDFRDVAVGSDVSDMREGLRLIEEESAALDSSEVPNGPSLFAALGIGHDSNADQAGSNELTSTGTSTGQASVFTSGLLDAAWAFETSQQTSLGPYYAADLVVLLDASVQDLSLQTHELGLRFNWAPSLKTRLELEGGGAHVVSGLQPVSPYAWEGAAAVKLDWITSEQTRARFRVAVRGSDAVEFDYLDGYRLDLAAKERWRLGNWELSGELLGRYNAAGVEEEQWLDPDPPMAGPCPPNCAQRSYLIPLSYWSPGVDLGLAWEPSELLTLALDERVEFRDYLEASGLQGPRAQRKFRQDWLFRTLFEAGLALERTGTVQLTFDQTLLISTSNMAYDPGDSGHDQDYADRNFIQHVSELGLQFAL